MDVPSVGTIQGGESGADSEQEVELPGGVAMEMMEQGREIFGAAGCCYACHGADAKGLPVLGGDLTDDEWI